ncbi:MAG: phosphatidate cytidylyltransferase [Clostridia bacterium]|nr:phosphatidate cytidylyltransferase [Clostridia bacterium]
MMKRTLSALVAVALLFVLIWADFASRLPLINIALGIILIAALFEIFRPFGFIKRFFLGAVGFALGISVFLGIGNMGFILMMSIIVMFVLGVTYHRTVSFSDICILLFTTLYISMGMLHIRMLHNGRFGLAMVFVALIAAFLTDTGAYFSGYFFGKHKLIPEISPKKTVEGAIGGVVICVISMLVYAWILIFFGIKANLLNIVITGVIASVVSQFGDLSASMIKRGLGIKDYGDIMPGHGGVLDRIDSLLFTAPAIYYLNILLPLMEEI